VITDTAEVVIQFGDPTTSVFPVFSISFDVAFAGTGSGTVTAGSARCTSACSTSAAYGYPLRLDALADSDSRFDHWVGACGTGSTCTVDAGPTTSIQAVFTKKPAPLHATLLSTALEQTTRGRRLRLKLALTRAATLSIHARALATGRLIAQHTYELPGGVDTVRLPLTSRPRTGRARISCTFTAPDGPTSILSFTVSLRG
jgi:hypothetical protein